MIATPMNAPIEFPRANTEGNPFPGLRSFEPDEDHLFFGRETQIDRLLSLLRETRFLAVVGTSGSGKSSLIRSGLVPSLYSGFMARAGSSWRVAIFRPGEDPIGNLAAALADPEVLTPMVDETEPELQAMHRSLMEATLRRGDLGLAECRRLAPIPPRDNLLVIADQFEELFRFKENRSLDNAAEASAAFIKLLLEAVAQDEVPVYVVLTMRSEFVGNCTEFAGFAEAINRGYYLIPRMSRQERREAIVGPVMVAGAEISPRLVTRLLNDVGEDPDQLPILQHALMRTWDHHQGSAEADAPLDIADYEAVGTLKEALLRHAEEAYAELDEGQQELAGRMFRALTDLGTGGRRVRSPCRLGDLCRLTGAREDELIPIIECFRLPGRAFLMPPHGTSLDSDSIIDISHESLMRVWGRLRSWVEEEARSAQTYRRLAKAAERFQEGKGGFWRDPELQTALNWQEQARPNELWAERYDPSFLRAMGFLEASRNERDQQLMRRERRRRRQLAWTRRIALAGAGAALIMALIGLYALDRKAMAEALHVEAEEGRQAAERERQVAVEQRQIADQQRREAEQQRRRAEEQQQIADEQRREAETQEKAAEAGRREAEAQKIKAEKRRLEAEQQRQRAEKESQRAQREEQKAREAKEIADLERRRAEARRRQARAKAKATQALHLSENQEAEAVTATLEAYRRYRQAERNLGDAVGRGAYDPTLYSALYQAWSWLARNQAGDEPRSWLAALGVRTPWISSHHEDAVRVLAVAPRGDLLASGDDAGKVSLLDLDADLDPAETEPATVLSGMSSAVRAVVWDPDGNALAAGAFDGSIQLWKLGDDSPIDTEPWSGQVCRKEADCHLRDLAFARQEPNGPLLLLSADSAGALRWWKPESERTSEPAGGVLAEDGGEAIVKLAATNGGRTLAVAHERTIRLFQLRESWRLKATLRMESDQSTYLRSLALRADGTILVAGTEDGVLLFFDLRGGESRPSARVTAHGSAVTAIAFAVEQELLATASLDGSVRLWRLREGRPDRQEPIDLEDHDAWVWGVALTADGERVISGGADRKLRVRATSASSLFEDLCTHSSYSCAVPLQTKEIR